MAKKRGNRKSPVGDGMVFESLSEAARVARHIRESNHGARVQILALRSEDGKGRFQVVSSIGEHGDRDSS
jgi:hypothetical protein